MGSGCSQLQSRSVRSSDLTELLQGVTAQHKTHQEGLGGQAQPGRPFQGFKAEPSPPQPQDCPWSQPHPALSSTNSLCSFTQLSCTSILRCDTDFEKCPEAKPAKSGYSGKEGLALTPLTPLSFQKMLSSTGCLSRISGNSAQAGVSWFENQCHPNQEEEIKHQNTLGTARRDNRHG